MKLFSSKANIIIFAVIILMLAAAGVTYAFLVHKSDTNINDFAGAVIGVNAAVKENDKEELHEDAGNNKVTYPVIKKGERVTKKVQIKNLEDSSPAYVRVKLIPAVVKDGSANEVLGQEVHVSYHFSSSLNWTYDKNSGTYYYIKTIAGGEESDALLEGITMQDEIPEGYHLELQVLLDAVAGNPETNLKNVWNLTLQQIQAFSKIS